MAGTGLQPLNIFLIVFPFILSFTIVSIRVWRKIKASQFVIEDALLVAAEVLLVALTATVWEFVLISYAGYHAEDIPKGAINVVDILRWRYINNAIYNPILGLAKISFLITLLKLRSQNCLIILSLWTLIVVNILFVFAATLGDIFFCWPIHKYWLQSTPGTCGDSASYIFGVIGVTIATDVLVSLIPAWIIYDLQMSLKHKAGVIVFLTLPLAVTAIGCYRLHLFVVIFSLPTVSAENPYNVRNGLLNVEANLGVIAACGPTIKWILGRFIPYFDTTPSTNPYTPNASSHLRQRSRGYVKSNGDIELRSEGVHTLYPRSVRNSCWKTGDDDADSEKQCIAVESGKDIRKTTVLEWGSVEELAPNSELHGKVRQE
ncbi:hypothetical protein BDW02DRAFT_347037 [Decorospora gaudefroyi]|uniref:Rhodopsin domain-containing protein n=1 Tax=Decorospora gaudefroyi TaxID=184978 RepID=A0A6A5KF65_9PLEO|nr:hypothetical protein BDW02DRAFT_347037 [Decorospora gaudefroyi]